MIYNLIAARSFGSWFGAVFILGGLTLGAGWLTMHLFVAGHIIGGIIMLLVALALLGVTIAGAVNG